MDHKEILKYCIGKGLLLDQEVLKIFDEASIDSESVKIILEKIKTRTNQRILTKDFLSKNKAYLDTIFLELPQEKQKNAEILKIKLGLNIQISKEVSIELGDSEKKISGKKENPNSLKILSFFPNLEKKIDVKDFVYYFRNRLSEMKKILQEHSNLKNLVSINKISGNKQAFSIIGLVSDKRITKTKSILFEVEDLTGKMRVLVTQANADLYKKAEEVSLDSVLGFKGFGNNEILFASDIIFPDCFIAEKKFSPIEEYALFTGDLHFGSKRFLEKSFLKFIDYLNGNFPNTPEVKKIKYLFIIGDLVTGIGNYPNQENDLIFFDLEEQFSGVVDLLKKIRKDIKIIICPGNHDGVRLMEPQPIFDEKYAWALYDMENVFLINNPSELNIGEKENFPGFDVLVYHGFSLPYYAGNIPSLIKAKAMNKPELILDYLLKNRHLAPTHASVQSFPSEKDFHLIKNVPDIVTTGHIHKSGVFYHNNILGICVSSWEGLTPYQEKFGNTPDHCKVPMFNLKTRAVRILDFEEQEDGG
ncbi:MAG: metallophosphoesterase [archaeon]